MKNPLDILARNGLLGTARIALRRAYRRTSRGAHLLRSWRAPAYRAPTQEELARIEADLRREGIPIVDYHADVGGFLAFQERWAFPPDFYGGLAVRTEKLLEHFLAAELLGVERYAPGDAYVDVAAADSPWVWLLSQRGVEATAIDLTRSTRYGHLPSYRVMDATRTTFTDHSTAGVSLHCAYEMFGGESDVALLGELSRILRPGGQAVILPLYLHTHDCAYATPEHYGHGHHDPGSREYVRRDTWGIPSSRKYSAATLKRRVLDRARSHGLEPAVLALRNKSELGDRIYCHFILVLHQPEAAS